VNFKEIKEKAAKISDRMKVENERLDFQMKNDYAIIGESDMEEVVDDYYMILKEMKQEEQNYLESILIVDSNSVLRDGIIAWQAVKCKRNSPNTQGYEKTCPYKGSIDKWNWLWAQTNFNQKHFAIVADVKVQDINNLYTRMTALRLIYPDGTIPNTVKGFLRNTLKAKFPQPKEKKEKKENNSKNELDK